MEQQGSSTSCARVVELTDGRQRKPSKIQDDCSIESLLKAAKNRFRKKYKYILLVGDEGEHWIKTDDELSQVLQNVDRPVFRVVNTINETTCSEVVSKPSRSICYIIGKQDDIEDNAIRQLTHASELKGCLFAIGMPDLHAGRGIPIGAVIMTEESVAYPQLVDNDIGCGMSFVETSLKKLSPGKAKRVAESLESMDCPYGSVDELRIMCSQDTTWGARQLEPLPELESHHYQHLGTVGGGNHFAELQEFVDVIDADALRRYGIDVDKVHLLVHSGSRGLGSAYLSQFCSRASEGQAAKSGPKHGHFAVDTRTPLFEEYLQNHNTALNYAARNRKLIAQRLLQQITGESDPLCKIDIYHNFMERVELDSIKTMKDICKQGSFPKMYPAKSESKDRVTGWIHRKGATPTNQSPILVIPGSRGTLSYLVEVNPEKDHCSAYSLAHGAGRRMARSKALKLHQSRYPNAAKLLQTDLGGVVICEKKELVYEEAPESYKDIDSVVQCMAGTDDEDPSAAGEFCSGGLVRVLATLRPLLTYKYRDPYGQK